MKEPIQESKSIAPSMKRRTYEGGSLEEVGGLSILRVRGTFREMGEQHGALLADRVKVGPIPYYRSMLERLLGKSLGPLGSPIASLIQRTIGAQVERGFPPFAVETMAAIARGAGLDEREFIRGCTMPDSLMWAAAQMNRYGGHGPASRHRLALGLGCTSAIAWGDSTVDGRLYHARNLDYHGVETWTDNATIIFAKPERGLRYVSVSSAGVALGGFTAMNEAGLTLAVHQHMFTDGTRLGGTPIGIVGDIVMREAETLEAAESILRRHRPIGCWTYLIADGRTRRMICFEENPGRSVTLRPAPDATTFGYSNIYEDAELGATEVASYGSYWRHNLGRNLRVKERLTERGLDARKMAQILGDTGSPPADGERSCRLRDSIGMVLTVASVVFRPEDGAFWVGVGPTPTSRGRFIPFSLEAEGVDASLGEFDTREPGEAEGDAAFEAYRKTFVAYTDRGDPKEALANLQVAIAAAPSEALYRSMAGLLALEGGAPAEAERHLTEAISLGHRDEERIASFYLWRGRARDLTGARKEAVADYRRCLAHRADPPVESAAKKNLIRPFSERARRRMHIEASLADVVTP